MQLGQNILVAVVVGDAPLFLLTEIPGISDWKKMLLSLHFGAMRAVSSHGV